MRTTKAACLVGVLALSCAGSGEDVTADGNGGAGAGGAGGVATGGTNWAGGAGGAGNASSGAVGGMSAGGSNSAGGTNGGGTGPGGSTAGGAGGTSPSGGTGGTLKTCAEIAVDQGWPGAQFTCDPGGMGWCAGTQVPSSDCAACCGPSCGILANHYGSSDAQCDNGTGICNGSGYATWDCSGGCCGTGIPNGGGGGTGGTSSGGTGGTSSGGTLKFGYPFGDKSTSPAGGSPWRMFQVLGHYWEDWKGVHLAQDIGGGAAFSPVYAVADGLVRVSTTNTSSYKNVVLLEHDMGDGTKICSFYAHLDSRTVQTGQTVTRGQQIATLMDQGTNTHLHYFFARPALCDRIANLNGAGACGYDGATSNPGVLHSDLSTEPPTYTAVGTDQWGCSAAGYEFISPSQFIDQHHF